MMRPAASMILPLASTLPIRTPALFTTSPFARTVKLPDEKLPDEKLPDELEL